MLSRLLVAGIAGAAFIAGSLTTATVVTTEFGSTEAYAKSDKSKGKSNKGGNKKSSNKGGKSANAAGKSNADAGGPTAKSKALSTKTAVVSVSAKEAKAEAKAAKVPGLDARLGALHAMNANINAYIHASPNSRVGKVAAYARSLVGIENAETAVNDATEALNLAQGNLSTAETNLNNALAELGALDPVGDYEYSDVTPDTLAARQTELESALATAVDDAEIAAINAELQAIGAVNTNQTAFDDATTAFGEATDNLAEAESDLMTAEEDATTALNDAANKTPVDEETRSYVDGQLEDRGILDYFRSETTAEVPEVEEEADEGDVAPEVEPVEIN